MNLFTFVYLTPLSILLQLLRIKIYLKICKRFPAFLSFSFANSGYNVSYINDKSVYFSQGNSGKKKVSSLSEVLNIHKLLSFKILEYFRKKYSLIYFYKDSCIFKGCVFRKARATFSIIGAIEFLSETRLLFLFKCHVILFVFVYLL